MQDRLHFAATASLESVSAFRHGAHQGGDDQGGRANRFARQSGIEITQDSPRGYAELKARVEDQNVTWDVMTAAA
ncbi:hypothetical protein ACFZBP_37915 [Streptomyces sp. NPDC008086]|uniref:hypothetical protein n=1 Tax=Streptomyces sp. NPDC008086 TaxID=3364807 RepID=UPI0036EAB5E7